MSKPRKDPRPLLMPGYSWDSVTNQPMPTSLLRARNATVQAEIRRIRNDPAEAQPDPRLRQEKERDEPR